MSTVDSRNASAKSYVIGMLKEVETFQVTPKFQKLYAEADGLLNDLVSTKANGFRGVVLTVIVGMYLDKNFNPKSNFYDCNPRSIFEKGIYYALTECKIPCGKSDPLNVAKNAQQLDAAWAKGRRPEAAAMAVVNYINLLWKSKDTKAYQDLVMLFFRRLYEYGQFVNSQNVSIVLKAASYNGTEIANKLGSFVVECAEGGALTQFVVGLLISYFRKDNTKIVEVDGYNESVFGTNTTSKKPADIWEVKSDGSLGKLYEITVKVIDAKRLDDCVNSLVQQEITDKEVIFICNLPSNIATLQVEKNIFKHNGVVFQFIDIKSFINSIFITLDDGEQQSYLAELQNFVFSANRAVATKQYWASLFANQ